MNHEELIIKITVIMNHLKDDINPALKNNAYQEWVHRNLLDQKITFRGWVIDDAKKEIIKLLDETRKSVASLNTN